MDEFKKVQTSSYNTAKATTQQDKLTQVKAITQIQPEWHDDAKKRAVSDPVSPPIENDRSVAAICAG